MNFTECDFSRLMGHYLVNRVLGLVSAVIYFKNLSFSTSEFERGGAEARRSVKELDSMIIGRFVFPMRDTAGECGKFRQLDVIDGDQLVFRELLMG